MRKIALHIVSALCLLRKEGVIHADIKPENIFVNWNNADSTSPIFSSSSSSSATYFYLSELPKNFDVRLGTNNLKVFYLKFASRMTSYFLQAILEIQFKQLKPLITTRALIFKPFLIGHQKR